MKNHWMLAALLGLLVLTPAFAIDAKYARQLERSGCTQVTELQGCDINKTKAENAQAGHAAAAPADQGQPAGKAGQTPYTGQWTAVGPTGGTVAKIRIDDKARVWVNGKPVKARRSDGALVFKQGFVTYTIQGDRRLKGQDTWSDSDAGSTGPIVAQ